MVNYLKYTLEMSGPLYEIGHLGDDAGNVTDANCTHGIQWIYHILNDCVSDDKGIASEILGLASILTWMIVSIPQMVKNCRRIEGIEGISLMLILMWTLGDSANLVGGILTKQLPLQIYLAVYFVAADLMLFSQFLYYNCIWKKKHREGYEPIPSSPNGAPPQVVLCLSAALFLTLHKSVSVITDLSNLQMIQIMSEHRPASRNLLAANLGYHIHIFHDIEDEVGYGIGIVSSIFYTFSRGGQMYKNYKRKTTDGLSIMMFVLAVLGNLTYGLSILVRQLDATYVLKHLPWLIGSLGVIFLDLSLLCQFYYYRDKDTVIRDKLAHQDPEIRVIARRMTIN